MTVLIPPGRGAQPSSSRSPGQRERNRNIRSMRKLGRKEWYATSGYSRRSLVENAVFRYKTILGPAYEEPVTQWPTGRGQSRLQDPEHDGRLGMPDSVKVE